MNCWIMLDLPSKDLTEKMLPEPWLMMASVMASCHYQLLRPWCALLSSPPSSLWSVVCTPPVARDPGRHCCQPLWRPMYCTDHDKHLSTRCPSEIIEENTLSTLSSWSTSWKSWIVLMYLCDQWKPCGLLGQHGAIRRPALVHCDLRFSTDHGIAWRNCKTNIVTTWTHHFLLGWGLHSGCLRLRSTWFNEKSMISSSMVLNLLGCPFHQAISEETDELLTLFRPTPTSGLVFGWGYTSTCKLRWIHRMRADYCRFGMRREKQQILI